MQTAIQDSLSSNRAEADPRPRFGIGHVVIGAGNVDALTDFYAQVGMRLVAKMGRMSIVELRGGTHLIIQSGQPGEAALDLIVDDIDDTRRVMAEAGVKPGSITRGSPHDRFQVLDPEGNSLSVASNHAIGPV